jgi:hypothetical protein
MPFAPVLIPSTALVSKELKERDARSPPQAGELLIASLPVYG